jgi:hypothetical protein
MRESKASRIEPVAFCEQESKKCNRGETNHDSKQATLLVRGTMKWESEPKPIATGSDKNASKHFDAQLLRKMLLEGFQQRFSFLCLRLKLQDLGFNVIDLRLKCIGDA